MTKRELKQLIKEQIRESAEDTKGYTIFIKDGKILLKQT